VSVRYPNVATVPKSASASIMASETPATREGRASGSVTATKARISGAAEASRGLERRGALLPEGGARQQVDVRIEDEGHREHDAPVRPEFRQSSARPDPPAQRALDRPGEVEEPEEREADHVRGHREGKDEGPLEHRAWGSDR